MIIDDNRHILLTIGMDATLETRANSGWLLSVKVHSSPMLRARFRAFPKTLIPDVERSFAKREIEALRAISILQASCQSRGLRSTREMTLIASIAGARGWSEGVEVTTSIGVVSGIPATAYLDRSAAPLGIYYKITFS